MMTPVQMQCSKLGFAYDWLQRTFVTSDYVEKVFVGLTLAVILYSIHLLLKWYAHVTDVTVGYSWTFRENGTQWAPSFDIRNRSTSKQYNLDSIVYLKKNAPIWIDNDSIFDKELKPESRHYIAGEKVQPIKGVTFEHPVQDGRFNTVAAMRAFNIQIIVRDQVGRVWRAVGPGQEQHRGRFVTFLLKYHWLVKMLSLE
jgi:hypothetical protein